MYGGKCLQQAWYEWSFTCWISSHVASSAATLYYLLWEIFSGVTLYSRPHAAKHMEWTFSHSLAPMTYEIEWYFSLFLPCTMWRADLLDTSLLLHAKPHRGFLSLGDMALPHGWFLLYACYKWRLGNQLIYEEANHVCERPLYYQIFLGCDTYSLETLSTLRFVCLSHRLSMFI